MARFRYRWNGFLQVQIMVYDIKLRGTTPIAQELVE